MKIKIWAATGALVSALALGACGSSGSSSSSSSSTSAGDVTAFCAKVKELSALQNPFQNVKPGDIQGAQDAVNKIKSEITSVDAVAPAAVKSEVDQVQKLIDDFAAATGKAKTQADFLKAAQSFQAEAQQLQTSVSKLQSYTQKNCKKA